MNPSDIFSIANMVVIPMWILMIVLPKWKVTQFLMDYKIIPILLSIVYAIFVVKSIQLNGLDFGSLESVMTLFTEENAVLAGWVHYLAFDLLVGMWMLEKNKKIKLNQVLMAPCLFGAFMLGPVGFLLFILFKTIKSRKQ